MRVEFTVMGVARPAGSKRAFALRRKNGSLVTRAGGAPVINVVDDCKKSGEWKQAVAWAARQSIGAGVPLIEGPVSLELRFYAPRPKNQYRTGRNAGMLRDDAPKRPIAKPDVLKLARAVEDALTGVVWHDDCQIVDEKLSKMWGTPARVEVVIEQICDVAALCRKEVSDGE